ncbi:MAG: hypothetical protein ACREPE_01430 [Lysobacter sp.]
MNALLLVAAAVSFGAGYLLAMTAFGEKLARQLWRAEADAELRCFAAPMLGVTVHAAATAAALLLVPAVVPWVAWAMVAVVVVDGRSTLRFGLREWRSLALVLGYGLLCFALLVGFHIGAARGDNLFWSIYKLTAITPGDSPQGLLQAQYLLHGTSLQELRDFSLFDRPFLGGIVSLGALSAIGQPPGTLFNNYPIAQTYLYIALWIWLNATFALTVAAIARRVVPRLGTVPTILMLAAPFVVFNIIGAWPKLFAAYILSVAALLALKGRWRWAVAASGVAFFVHGSFLWAHLSMCGVLVLYLAFFASARVRVLEPILLAALAVAFPAAWFLGEGLASAATPLRTYYLYAVPVSHGLAHDAGEIARNFYASTTPGHLSLLPFMNVLKGLLPVEMLSWLLSFSINGAGTDLRGTAGSLFYTQFYRPVFAFCLVGGGIALLGLRRALGQNWLLALAVAALFLLPLIPGMGLYRRDDHFVLPVMVFAVLPLAIAFALGLHQLSRTGLLVAVTLMFGEYALVYWSRYPGIRYQGEFYEYYVWLSLAAVALAYTSCLRSLNSAQAPGLAVEPDAPHPAAVGFMRLTLTPARFAAASLLLVAVAGLAAPGLIQRLAADGGFQRHGWRMDLAKWPNLKADRNDQALLHTDLRTTENGVQHSDIWINSGQSLVFRDVPATTATAFSVSARIHPAWNGGSSAEPIALEVVVHGAKAPGVAAVVQLGAGEASDWHELRVALAPYAGSRRVDLEIRPKSATAGTWTLWRDPAITIVTP